MACMSEDGTATESDDWVRTDNEPAVQSQLHDKNAPDKEHGGAADESGTDTDEDGELIKAKAQVAQQQHQQEQLEKKLPTKKRPQSKGRPGGVINLRDLLEEQILTAGEDVLSVEYKGNVTYATLSPEGHIICNLQGKDQRFESPSAFSIALKRLVNPLRKADDGWKTVKYNGRFLDAYKLELAQRRLAEIDGGASDIQQPSAKRSKTASGSDVGSRRGKESWTSSAAQSSAMAVGSNLEDVNQMIPCERFGGEPCSSSGSQPFRVIVSPGAELLLDFHAHLSTNEVAGLLGGSWEPQERVLRVERAFPVQEVQSIEDMATVDMVAADEKAVRQKIMKSHGLSCVGWYHSHPQAGPHPSTLDISAQLSRQKQHSSGCSTMEPYIGAIVSPYNTNELDGKATISYFCVDHPKDSAIPHGADPVAEGCLPMIVEVEREEGPSTEAYIVSMPHHEMRSVVHRCANSSRRTDIASMSHENTRLEKLKAAVISRLPQSWAPKRVEEYGTKVEAIVTAAWKIFGQPFQSEQVQADGMRKAKGDEEDLDISDISADNKTDSTQWA